MLLREPGHIAGKVFQRVVAGVQGPDHLVHGLRGHLAEIGQHFDPGGIIVTILLGFCVGASTQAQTFLTPQSLLVFGLGAASFAVATAGGVLFAKFMNLFVKDKINPLIGAAGVSAVPDSARVAQMMGQREDPSNFLLMHDFIGNAGLWRGKGGGSPQNETWTSLWLDKSKM